MSYQKIPNLYKDQKVLLFKEVYCLEKIHGSSSNIKYNSLEGIKFFSGGEKHETFVKIFNQETLLAGFIALAIPTEVTITIFGEVYGGKCQGMSETYGKEMKFVAFDVRIGETWLEIPKAEEIVKKLGLEFVHYVKTTTDLAELDAQRDAPSVQAVRNGITEPKIREGTIIRPIIEVGQNNGERIAAKHKRDEFRETASPRPVVDPARLEVLEKADAIANEWATHQRLLHVLQKIPNAGMEQMRDILAAMNQDIEIEAKGEIILSDEAKKAISKKTALMFKQYLSDELRKNNP